MRLAARVRDKSPNLTARARWGSNEQQRGGVVSTQDDRFGRGAGPGAGTQGEFDESGFTSTSQTSLINQRAAQDSYSDDGPSWHAGLDVGLLLVRWVLGGLFIAHGLQKLGMFGGVDGRGGGVGAFAGVLESAGYSQTTALAWVTTVTELGAGALLVFGLFTSLAAAGLLGVMFNAVIAMKLEAGFFAGDGGFELEMVLGVAALALAFTGAGRVALDRRTRWFSHAPAFGLVSVLIAAAASAVVLLVFR
ncbi:MAG: DoxX family membrane protein [Pseudonocardiaceae bacterium]|nr:DoxX family membrane protein [Pseudonocardiaceae bacterium]